ncbi:MAG: AMIN domain-containing protein, partial [Phycisphaerae bacterium]
MRTVRLVAAALALAFVAAFAGSSARAEPVAWISEVRLGQHRDHTRIVLRVDRKLDFELFTLETPYRIVIDFPEVGWRVDPRSGSHAVGLVRGYRYGSYKPGTSRMVIDLAGPAMVANRFLLPPEGASGEYRLVLDLAPTDAANYAAS